MLAYFYLRVGKEQLQEGLNLTFTLLEENRIPTTEPLLPWELRQHFHGANFSFDLYLEVAQGRVPIFDVEADTSGAHNLYCVLTDSLGIELMFYNSHRKVHGLCWIFFPFYHF